MNNDPLYLSFLCPVTQFMCSFSSFTMDWPYVYFHCPRPPPLADLAHSTSTLLAQVAQQALPSPHLLLHQRHALFEFQVHVQTDPHFHTLVTLLENTIEANRQAVRALVKLHVFSTSVLDRVTLIFQSFIVSSSSHHHPSSSSSSSSFPHQHNLKEDKVEAKVPFTSPSTLTTTYTTLLTTVDQEVQQWHHLLLATQHQLALLETQLKACVAMVVQLQTHLQHELNKQGLLQRHWYQFRGGQGLAAHLQLHRQHTLLSSTQVHQHLRQVSQLALLLDHFELTLEAFKKKSIAETSSSHYWFEMQHAVKRLVQAKQKALDMWKDSGLVSENNAVELVPRHNEQVRGGGTAGASMDMVI